MTIALVLALSLFQAGTARPGDPADVLLAADRAFFEDTRKNGLESWLGWFAEDVVVVPPNGPLVVGSGAIRRHYEGQRFPPPGFAWEPGTASISTAGDLGWTIGHWGSDASGTAVWSGKYMTVWRKNPGGAWRVVIDCPYDPGYDKHLPGLKSPPRSRCRDSERVFRSSSGNIEASVGSWWAHDDGEGECGGKFLEVWRRYADQSLKVQADTGILQARR